MKGEGPEARSIEINLSQFEPTTLDDWEVEL